MTKPRASLIFMLEAVRLLATLVMLLGIGIVALPAYQTWEARPDLCETIKIVCSIPALRPGNN